MDSQSLAFLVHALSSPRAAFILGAGASAPQVPTFASLASRLAEYATRLSGFPASPIPNSGLRALMSPVIEQARNTSDLAEWKAGAMTTATIAIVLEHLISSAHFRRLPQYEAFALFARDASITSFNWDGLARSRCPQRVVLHPHGTIRPRLLDDARLDDLLFDTQMIDSVGIREAILPGLVVPGEEEGQALSQMREAVLHLWMNAPIIVVIGYSFGLASDIDYDRVWLDTLVEACSRNRPAPIHVIAPDADRLVARVSDLLDRRIDIFAWSYRWNVLADVLLKVAASQGMAPLASIRVGADACEQAVDEINRRTAEAT